MALAHFLIHSIPTDVWVAAQTRAQREKWPLRALCVQLLEDYANGAVTPTTPPPSGATMVQRVDPRAPWRTAVIATRNPQRQLRLQCIAAGEAAGYLVLLNHEGEGIARFWSADVESWFLED